ncbi:peptidoglycan DD-metalloendopeptidase family protein [Patescibacteria group bacterium]|nr:peptidoglycan DD-metalloendopeptidase family protein [Patescibacteria group bacterium]
MKSIITSKKILFFLFLSGFIFGNFAFATEVLDESKEIINDKNPDELRDAINTKTNDLLEINKKIEQVQEELKKTEGKSNSLQKEIVNSGYKINQIDLSIRASEINTQKLKLEIESLKYDIKEIKSVASLKKIAISNLLRELQKKDDETTFIILLKNKTITATLDEAKNILDINSGLSTEVKDLLELNDKLSDNLIDSADKKSEEELESKNSKNRKIILENEKSARQDLLALNKNEEKEYQQQISQLEEEQNFLSKEIDEVESKLRESFDPNLLPIKRHGVLAYPVKLIKEGGIAIITQEYGVTPYSSQLYESGFHNGLDFGIPIGTPIFASDDGEVIAVDYNDVDYWRKYQFGRYVLIEHSNNLSTVYAHLSTTNTKEGDFVKRGDLIGYSGNSGYSTGPHLHFGVYWGPSLRLLTATELGVLRERKYVFKGSVPLGVTVDPENYL